MRLTKRPSAIAIDVAYARHQYQPDSYIAAYINRHYLSSRGRSCGKTYFANQQYLLHQARRLSAGATLKFLQHEKPSCLIQRIISYDPASDEDKSVECVFKRNLATGDLTLVSANVLSRKWQNSPWFYLDEWPWA
ncbi:hypothetical protein [Serratia fonticola]|uniref:hypothetical protein n=1 Tax=Serratia fonticola TaxID=47917 RepID=UPI00301D31ED